MRNNEKIGHLAPRGHRYNIFNYIQINGELKYCASHDFVYDGKEEERKLYNGEACYYTDKRFTDSFSNFYGKCYLKSSRWKDISLKACIRRVLRCKNIPVGTIVNFNKSWYFSKKDVDLSYNFKVKKENKLDLKYEISFPEYFDNFKTCEFSKNLTDALRQNGFIVRVESENMNFLSGMIATAAAYSGTQIETKNEDGETAVAYGHGLKVGFSSKDNTMYGYHDGVKNILFDKLGEFNKWSRCRHISKDTPINEIIDILLKVKTEPSDEN